MSISEQTLLDVVARLENLCRNLEASKTNVAAQLVTTENITAFTEYWKKTLQNLLNLKSASTELKNEDIDKITEIVCEAICGLQDILVASETFKKPVNADQQTLIKKLASIWSKLGDIYKGKKEVYNHGEAAKNGLDALFWVFSDSMCDQVTQTYLEQIDFPGNKILAMKQPLHTKWLNSFKTIIKELNELVKKNYKCGLSWNVKGETDISKLVLTIGNSYRKNFKKEENVVDVKQESRNKLFEELGNENARKNLKPVTKVEEKKQEEIHPLLAAESKKDKSTANRLEHIGRRETLTKKGKQEKYEEGKALYFFENLVNEQKELNEKLENKSIIQISNCSDSTFKIPKKVNAIRLTNCENLRIYCDSLVTMFEITNSSGISIDVSGVINAFSIDSCRKVALYLTNLSAQAQFITSKSSETFIRLRDDKDKDNYKEYPIPEQFVFNLNNGKLECKVSELYS